MTISIINIDTAAVSLLMIFVRQCFQLCEWL